MGVCFWKFKEQLNLEMANYVILKWICQILAD